MHTILLTAIAVLGVDVGWQPTDTGDMEYIIQIEPHQLKTLGTGDTIEVGVRPELRNVRRYRIVVGDEQLPRVDDPPKLSAAPPDDALLVPPGESDRGVARTSGRVPADKIEAGDTTLSDGDGRNSLLVRPQADTGLGVPRAGLGRTETPLLGEPNRPPSLGNSGGDWTNRGGLGRRYGEAPDDGNTATQRSALTDAAPKALDSPDAADGFTASGSPSARDDTTASQPLPLEPLTPRQGTTGRRYAEEPGDLSTPKAAIANPWANPQADIQTPANVPSLRGSQLQPLDTSGLKTPTDQPITPSTDDNRRLIRLDDRFDRGRGDETMRPTVVGGPSTPEVTQPLPTAANNPSDANPGLLGARYALPESSLPRSVGTEAPDVTSQTPRWPPLPTPSSRDSMEEIRKQMALRSRNTDPVQTPQPAKGRAAFDLPSAAASNAPSATPPDSSALTQPGDRTMAVGLPTGSSVTAPSTEQNQQAAEKATPETESVQTSRSWLPLTLSLLALFASLGANFYLGWMTLDIRRRFRHFAYSLRHQEEVPKHL